MTKDRLEKWMRWIYQKDIDFGEIFYEERVSTRYLFMDEQLDKIDTEIIRGVGIRIVDHDLITYYASTNDLTDENIKKTITSLTSHCQENVHQESIILQEAIPYKQPEGIIFHDQMKAIDKKKFLKQFDQRARAMISNLSQVTIKLNEEDQKIVVANTKGVYQTDQRMNTSVTISLNKEANGQRAFCSRNFGNGAGYELLETVDQEKVLEEMKQAIEDQLVAQDCAGGKMPVIIGPGFGAVIFHEACGHAMEASSVAKKLSVLAGKLNQKIASSKVTIIDDGTIDGAWGTTNFDDEGRATQKNILIEDGILKNYLIDEINGVKMKMTPTGSSRRQNYTYPPTSRMNNTYLKKGNDQIEDMIQSIPYGLYAKVMGGGSVNTATGDFNFSVNEAYMIRDGKIQESVKAASLIGNTVEILQNVEMVSDDLKLACGTCGAESGWVPVTIGQPTIKVSEILVGGAKNDR